MTHKIGEKGQVVIPKAIRDELGLTPGTEVDFELRGEHVEIGRSPDTHSLRGILAGSNALMELEQEHARERQ